MSKNIICPNCNTENDCREMSKEELLAIHCGNCATEIGRSIPKNYLLYNFYYFLLNAFIYALIICTSAYIFENYYEWKSISGFIFLFSIYLASIALHEFFHAFFGYIFGDYTILDNGYLRLNILKYFDGIHSFIFPGIMILFFGIFLPGAAVYIQTDNIKYRLNKFIVNFSGIFSQVIFLYFLLFLINSNNLFFSKDFEALLHVAAYFQLILLIFNLLPLPGLDGWQAIFSLIFPKIGNFISRYFSMPSIILFISLVIFNEEFSFFISDNLDILSEKIGINYDLFLEGFEYMLILDIDTFVVMKDGLVEFIKKL